MKNIFKRKQEHSIEYMKKYIHDGYAYCERVIDSCEKREHFDAAMRLCDIWMRNCECYMANITNDMTYNKYNSEFSNFTISLHIRLEELHCHLNLVRSTRYYFK